MNEILKAFFKEKEEEELQKRKELIKEQEEVKSRILIELGLYEKVYAPDNVENNEYNCYEYDYLNQMSRYFKKVPIEITDEEYEQIKKYTMQTEKNESKHKNTIATILSVMAWIVYVSGFICGIVLGANQYGSFFLILVYWIAAFTIGTMFHGFAEIIRLLTEIKNK